MAGKDGGGAGAEREFETVLDDLPDRGADAPAEMQDMPEDGGDGGGADDKPARNPDAGKDELEDLPRFADEADADSVEGDGEGEADEADADSVEGDGEGEDSVEGEDPDADLADIRSESVRKRILRERDRRRAAEDALAESRQETRRALENLNGSRQAAVALAEKNLKRDLDEAKAELKRANEDGDTDKIVELQVKIGEISSQQRELAKFKTQVDDEAKRPPQAGQANPLTEAWKKRNAWFGDPNYAAERLAVFAIDKKLTDRGMKPDSPSYFAALDRELNATQTRIAKMRRGEQQRGRPPARQPVAPASSGASRPASGGRVTITLRDQQNMRQFGLDPKNPQDVKAYAAEMRNSLRSAGAR